MPVQVLVVKRARRRAFAMLWAVPDWLRSAWSGLLGIPFRDRAERRASEQALALWRAQAASRRGALPMRPRLRPRSEGGHGCTGCGRCPEVCPSRCLDLEVAVGAKHSSPGEATVLRFELDAGACIGCGRCIEVCPVSALENESVPAAILSPVLGTASPLDLLALGEKAS